MTILAECEIHHHFALFWKINTTTYGHTLSVCLPFVFCPAIIHNCVTLTEYNEWELNYNNAMKESKLEN